MFTLCQKDRVFYYTIPSFEQSGLVRHCFTTRRGGVSKNEYESMNLRVHCADDPENVKENFRIICDTIGAHFENLVFSNQVHHDTIYTVTEKDCGRGLHRERIDEADGLICAASNIPIVIFSADCVPLYFLDTKNHVIGLAHSGWKGTVQRIGQKMIQKMKKEYGSCAENILVAIGPHIGACHFEVGDEVADIFRETFGDDVLVKHDKYHVDMQKAILMQFAEEGISDHHITCADVCTYCQGDLLFSHRLTNGRRGVCAAIMEMIE